MPRVVAFVNRELGRHAFNLLKDDIVAVVVNEKCDYLYGPLTETPWQQRWYMADDPNLAARLKELEPTHGVSAGFRSIIRKNIIDLFPHGIANVHTSLLPFGRGAHPNAWAIFYDQTAGVTIHLVDEGVDTGPVIAQWNVACYGHDTASTLQDRLIIDAKKLMGLILPQWLDGKLRPFPQARISWPTHRKADLEYISIDGEKKYHGWEVINILRARTYPPYPGALYTAPNGKRYRVRIDIEEDHASQDRCGTERLAQREPGAGAQPDPQGESGGSGRREAAELLAADDHRARGSQQPDPDQRTMEGLQSVGFVRRGDDAHGLASDSVHRGEEAGA